MPPFFCHHRYDGKSARDMILARSGTQNVMTAAWKKLLDLAEIV
jgi:hypothetical protein